MNERVNSQSVKDRLIELIAFEKGFAEDVVEKVIRFQGEDLVEALKIRSQIEISGFGVLYVAKTKLKKIIKNFQHYLETGKDEKKKENITKLLNYLKQKNVQTK